MVKRTQRKTNQRKTLRKTKQRKTQRKTKQRRTLRKTKQRKTQRKKTYKLKGGGTFTYGPLNCKKSKKSKCEIKLTLTTLTINYRFSSKTFNLPIRTITISPTQIKFKDSTDGKSNIYTLTPHSDDTDNIQYNKLQDKLKELYPLPIYRNESNA